MTRFVARVEDLIGQELVLAGGQKLSFDQLLLATGALAVPPTFPGSDLAGIVKLDGLDDTRHILKLARAANRPWWSAAASRPSSWPRDSVPAA